MITANPSIPNNLDGSRFFETNECFICLQIRNRHRIENSPYQAIRCNGTQYDRIIFLWGNDHFIKQTVIGNSDSSWWQSFTQDPDFIHLLSTMGSDQANTLICRLIPKIAIFLALFSTYFPLFQLLSWVRPQYFTSRQINRSGLVHLPPLL